MGIQEFSSLWLVLGTTSRGAPGRMRADSTSHPLGASPSGRRHLSTPLPENPGHGVSKRVFVGLGLDRRTKRWWLLLTQTDSFIRGLGDPGPTWGTPAGGG